MGDEIFVTEQRRKINAATRQHILAVNGIIRIIGVQSLTVRQRQCIVQTITGEAPELRATLLVGRDCVAH